MILTSIAMLYKLRHSTLKNNNKLEVEEVWPQIFTPAPRSPIQPVAAFG